VVFRARGPQGPVALKLLLDQDPRSVRRFKQEGAVALRIKHPNALRGIAQGMDKGRAFLVTELIDGEDLERRVWREGAPPIEAVRRLLAPIGWAIQHCHELGLVHRDLKPANVLLERGTQRPVVVDYGLVARDPVEFGELSIDDFSRLTDSGEIQGTPAYMAPEQANASFGEVGPLTDVYALGGILYFLLTTESPYRGKDPYHLLQKLADRAYPEPDPGPLAPDAPADLIALCRACLARDPALRPRSAAEFARAVRGADAALDDWAPPRRARSSGRTWTWLAAVTLGSLAIGAALMVRSLRTPELATVTPEAAVQQRLEEFVARGWAELEAKRPQIALDWAAQAEVLDRGNASVALLRAEANVQLKRFDEALAELDRVLEGDPEHLAARSARGNLHRTQGRYALAEADLSQALVLEPDDRTNLRRRGLALNALGRTAEAVACFERILALGHRGQLVYENVVLGRLELGDLRGAEEALEEGVRTLPRQQRFGLLTSWSEACEATNRRERAVRALDRVLEESPEHAAARYRRCKLLLAFGERRQARADALAYVRRYPDDVHGPTLLGLCDLYDGAARDAAQRFEDAKRRKDPADRYEVLHYRALALMLDRRPAEAEAELKLAHELRPEAPWPSLWLAGFGLDAPALPRYRAHPKPWVARVVQAMLARDLGAREQVLAACDTTAEQTIALAFLGLLAERELLSYPPEDQEQLQDLAHALYDEAVRCNGTRTVTYDWAAVRARALAPR